MTCDPNEPAALAMVNPHGFGCSRKNADGMWEDWAIGLTKREHFAALALQGLLACSEVHGSDERLSACAVKFADALIAELNK